MNNLVLPSPEEISPERSSSKTSYESNKVYKIDIVSLKPIGLFPFYFKRCVFRHYSLL